MRRYDPNHPFKDYEYAWFNSVDENSVPIINLTKYKDVPNKVQQLKHTRLKLNSTYDHCAITGVKLVFGSEKLINSTPRKLLPVWNASVEHLCAKKHHQTLYSSDHHNFISVILLAGRQINYHFGHDIAALKLYFRRMLKSIQYDREDYLNKTGNYDLIFNLLIELEHKFRFEGKYPWQPWTYDDPVLKEKSQTYLDYHLKWEKDFLFNLTLKDRDEAFDNAELPELDIKKL